jgi:hypothetical protein
MGQVMLSAIAQKKMNVRADVKNVADGGSKRGGGSDSIGHTAETHGPTTSALDVPAGPERKGVRVANKKGPAIGLGGGRRSPSGGGLNIGGY